MRVRVRLAPDRTPIPSHTVAVVIDVLRATTTLTFAFSCGARLVTPVASPEEAMALGRRDPEALLCGERDGMKIPGFDLGNSPEEYRPQVVGGKHLVFASTNGSLAMLEARAARRCVLAAFVNARAALEAIARERDVLILCAGKLGQPSLEDTACAGWLCDRLVALGAVLEGPSARLARALAPADVPEIRALVQGSSHGRYLRSLGPVFTRDVEMCAGLDLIDRAYEL